MKLTGLLTHYRRFLTGILFLAVAIVSLVPRQYIPPELGLFQLDKLIHLLMYFTLTFSCLWAFGNSRMKGKLLLLTVLVAIFGISMEIAQGILPLGRSFSGYDIIANTVGCVLGAFFFLKRPVTERKFKGILNRN